MGYFSNGSEGSDYEHGLCVDCVHYKDGECPVWRLHMEYNYDECNKPDSFLHVLIPRKDGKNKVCTMFIKKLTPTKTEREEG